jgi:glycerol-3-phosphate dehydrogenase
VFGGKITTYRRLAEAALARLTGHLPVLDKPSWTGGAQLPGGDFPATGYDALVAAMLAEQPWAERGLVARLLRAYGTDTRAILAGADSMAGLGRCFGADLTEREVRWLMDKEWAVTADDVLWRRSKLGLRLTADERAGLDAFMAEAGTAPAGAAKA